MKTTLFPYQGKTYTDTYGVLADWYGNRPFALRIPGLDVPMMFDRPFAETKYPDWELVVDCGTFTVEIPPMEDLFAEARAEARAERNYQKNL